MTHCLNTGCRFCSIDTEAAPGGAHVCAIDPTLITVDTLQGWMLKCNSYKYRPAGQSLGPVHPSIGPDGLYPGQIKAPIDYSDVDPDAPVIKEDLVCST